MTFGIRAKLFGGFGVVFALFAFAIVVASINMATMNQRAERIAGNDVPSIAAIGQAIQHVEWYRATQIAHTISTSAELMTEREKTLVQESSLVTAAFARAGGLLTNARDHSFLTSLERQWQSYLEATNTVPALDRAGQFLDARALLNAQKPEMSAIVDGLSAWSTHEQSLAAGDRVSAASAYNTARLVLWVLAAVALLVGAMIAFLLSRSIASRAVRMLRAADGIASGDVNQTVDSSGGDELAKTGAAFERMIAYLQQQPQPLTGLPTAISRSRSRPSQLAICSARRASA